MPPLRSHEQFENREALISFLSELLARGQIALFLGAGISEAMSLPDWDGLLESCFETKELQRPTQFNFKRQAEILRTKFYKDDNLGFEKFIKEELYKNVDPSFTNLNKLKALVAISSLVMASRRGFISEVVTFNWDNLLELFLSYHGFVVNSIIEPRHWSKQADVTIIHPHGYLPYNSSKFSENIIFDQKSYSKIQGDPTNLFNQKILTIMRSNFSIFIGLSGEDDNLDSLVETCSNEHIAKREQIPFWGITFNTNSEDLSIPIWKDRGIFPQIISDYEEDMPSFLFQICQQSAYNAVK
jgi:NAD-dependent SIR2 family protein deacetylase